MNADIVYFGGGCFWNAELVFSKIDGIISTQVGFCQVSNDDASPVEVVKLEYNPKIINFNQLIDVFWTTHNPSNPINQKQSNQERSVIFYCDDTQKQIAKAKIKELSKKQKVYTSVSNFLNYKKASEKDQKYYYSKTE